MIDKTTSTTYLVTERYFFSKVVLDTKFDNLYDKNDVNTYGEIHHTVQPRLSELQLSEHLDYPNTSIIRTLRLGLMNKFIFN